MRRLAALGSIALLPVSFLAHLEMSCLPAPVDASGGSGTQASQHADHSHHAQHAAAAGEDASDSPSESESIPWHGQCNLCCPQGATIVAVEPDVVSGLVVEHVSPLDAEALVLRRAPHLLPFPNPPPIA